MFDVITFSTGTCIVAAVSASVPGDFVRHMKVEFLTHRA